MRDFLKLVPLPGVPRLLVFALPLMTMVFFQASAFAQGTTISGGNLTELHWTPSGSPYRITGEVTVDWNDTLTVEAGTVAEFAPGSRLEVDGGALRIEGTAANPVFFRSSDPEARWQGIVQETGGRGVFISHLKLSGAQTGMRNRSLSGATIEQSEFDDNDVHLWNSGGRIFIDRVRIAGGGSGLLVDEKGYATLQNSVLTDLEGPAAGFEPDRYATPSQVTHCTFHNIRNELGNAAVFRMAASTISSSKVLVRNTSISQSDSAFVCELSRDECIEVRSSNLWNVGVAREGEISFTSVSYENPRYADPDALDLRLLPDSPLVDSAEPTTPVEIDFDGTLRPQLSGYDVGAFELAATCGDGENCGGGGASCGNGVVDSGEACDDGNVSNRDDCLNSCEQSRCGDSFVQGAEECDDGNRFGSDACTNECKRREVTRSGSNQRQTSAACQLRWSEPSSPFLHLGFGLVALLWLRRNS